MNDLLIEQLFAGVQKGSTTDCQTALNKGADKNSFSSEGETPITFAAQFGFNEIVRFFISIGADINMKNQNNEDTALHIACEKENKPLILLLLMGGADNTIVNKKNEKPGENQAEIKSFINSIMGENKAFTVLTDDMKRQLKNIFDDMDKDGARCINLEKSKNFNMFMEGVPEDSAEKDATEFISSCAICNKETVSFDEWLFAFAKLVAVDPPSYTKFIEDYEKNVAEKGPFKSQALL